MSRTICHFFRVVMLFIFLSFIQTVFAGNFAFPNGYGYLKDCVMNSILQCLFKAKPLSKILMKVDMSKLQEDSNDKKALKAFIELYQNVNAPKNKGKIFKKDCGTLSFPYHKKFREMLTYEYSLGETTVGFFRFLPGLLKFLPSEQADGVSKLFERIECMGFCSSEFYKSEEFCEGVGEESFVADEDYEDEGDYVFKKISQGILVEDLKKIKEIPEIIVIRFNSLIEGFALPAFPGPGTFLDLAILDRWKIF